MNSNTERSSLTTSVIVGSLLGDGSIVRNRKWVFEESHTEKQKDYITWKSGLVQNSYLNTINRSFGPVYRLRANGEHYLKLREKWYPNGKKIIPKELMQELDEIALLVWYMDDGDKVVKRRQPLKHLPGLVQYNVCRITTACFTYKENLYLRRILHKKFGIQPVIVREKSHDKSYYRLYFSKDNYDKFMEIMRRQFELLNLPECMRYKLGERVENRRGVTRQIMNRKGLIPRNKATGRFASKRYVPSTT